MRGLQGALPQAISLARKFKLPILLRGSLLDEADNELGPETLAPPVVTVSYNGPVPLSGGDPNDFVVRCSARPRATPSCGMMRPRPGSART